MTDIFEIDALGTHWWIERLDSVWAPNDSAFLAHEIQSFNDAYTRFTVTSLIGQLNCKKKLVHPPQELLDMFAFSQKMHALSDGVFNISAGSELFKRGYGMRKNAANVKADFWDEVNIKELTQHAKAQYTDADMGNDAKRTVLTKLFDEIVYASNSVSVKLSFLAESIAKRSDETRQIMETQKVLSKTAEKNENNRGEINKKDLKNEIYPVWQGHVESNHDLRFWRPLY